MASSYVNDLRLNEMATGDASGTWGETTNTNLELIGEAFSYGTEAITTNADTHTTTIADGATDPGRALYLKYTGTLDSACTITIGPNTVSKVWIIENGTSGSQDIILSQGSGANITIPAGDTKVVYSDGAGAGAAFFDAFASLSVVDLKVQDDLTVTGDIDVDGTTNLDVVDIDGAVDMASTALVTGVLTTTAATVFNGGFASNAASTISTADNLDTLSLISTDADANSGPNLRLYRNSGSPADSDVLGHIQYEGRNDNSQDVVYSEILTLAADVSDGTEDAIVYIQSMVAGTVRERISILPGETVFNENSVDLDFRVESDNDANALFVQGSDGFVGIGTASPSRKLHISSSGTDCAIRLDNTVSERPFLLAYDDSQNLTFTNSSDSGYIAFVNGTGAGTERVRIDSSGNLLVGGDATTTTPTLNKGIYLLSSTNEDVIGYSLYANEGTNNRRASFFLDDTNGVYGFDTTASSGVVDFVVRSAAAERLRIDSSGYVKVNNTTGIEGQFSSLAGAFYAGAFVNTSAAFPPIYSWNKATSGDNLFCQFYIDTLGSLKGTIDYNRGAGLTRYNTSSDATLKNIIGDSDGVKSVEILNSTRIREFAWKDDETQKPQIGVIAQELYETYKGAVSVGGDLEKTDDEGNVTTEYQPWAVDKTAFTFHLVAGWQVHEKIIQEQQALIESLTARITTLEG
jgi:hypothetical protein